jgi:hypothetical protein
MATVCSTMVEKIETLIHYGKIASSLSIQHKRAKNFENVKTICLSGMKCQYTYCCFIVLITYNLTCWSGTKQASLSHQNVNRDDIADIISLLMTHCMSWRL